MNLPALMPHQEIVKDYIVDHPHAGIFLGVGAGKTFSVLHALSAVRPSGHILVVAPVNIARSTWIDEIKKWKIPLRTRSLIVNDNDKKLSRAKRLERYKEVFTDQPTMYFISQDLIRDLVNEMPVVGKGKNAEIQWPFPTVIIDESQGVKSPSGVRFKALKQVRPAIIRLIELTGTPVPNGLLDLWAQVYLLDQGLALGHTMTAYKEKYFTVSKIVNNRPVAWEPRPGAKEEIYARITHLVMSTENTNIDMPEKLVQEISVSMTKDELEAYKDFRKNLVLDLAAENPGEPIRTIVAQNQAVLTNKLVQFASGTLYTDDEKNYVILHEHKIEMADYLIRNTQGPVMMAYRFKSDQKQLLKRLTEMGHDIQQFDGSNAMIHKWNRGEIPVMILHPASAGHGLNLQGSGNTLIWYTVPDSLEHFVQTNGRLARMGQAASTVNIYLLITQGTRDTRLPINLERKQMVHDGLMNAVQIVNEEFEDLAQEINQDLYGDIPFL